MLESLTVLSDEDKELVSLSVQQAIESAEALADELTQKALDELDLMKKDLFVPDFPTTDIQNFLEKLSLKTMSTESEDTSRQSVNSLVICFAAIALLGASMTMCSKTNKKQPVFATQVLSYDSVFTRL